MLPTSGLVLGSLSSDGLRPHVDEAIEAAGGPPADGAGVAGPPTRLNVVADDARYGPQAYHLAITLDAGGPRATVTAGDTSGALFGLRSLVQLVAGPPSQRAIRQVLLVDGPGFARRGVILDPYVLPDVGVTEASQELLLQRLQFGAEHKLNFLDLVDRTPWPELVGFCAAHEIELMSAIGYKDALTRTPLDVLKARLDELLAAGTRSFSLNWDDIGALDPEPLARSHAQVYGALYQHVRRAEPSARLYAVLPPYGGLPGSNLVTGDDGKGERYLAAIRDLLPDDVRVFWTGDGGVFSETVTTEGARAYSGAVGHELAFWDNNALWFANGRVPCRGRGGDLATVIPLYMANLAGEAHWAGNDAEFALLTMLDYAWNPTAYDPATSAAAAERILAE